MNECPFNGLVNERCCTSLNGRNFAFKHWKRRAVMMSTLWSLVASEIRGRHHDDFGILNVSQNPYRSQTRNHIEMSPPNGVSIQFIQANVVGRQESPHNVSSSSGYCRSGLSPFQWPSRSGQWASFLPQVDNCLDNHADQTNRGGR